METKQYIESMQDEFQMNYIESSERMRNIVYNKCKRLLQNGNVFYIPAVKVEGVVFIEFINQ